MSEQVPLCPICGAAAPAGRYRPFCSSRCQLIDLGNWLGERYAVPGDEASPESPPEEDPASDGERDLPHGKGSR